MALDERDYFFSLGQRMVDGLASEEAVTCQLRAESSSFVRFNRGRVGQGGEVRQRQLELDLIRGARHASGNVNLVGSLEHDLATLRATLETLREMRDAVGDDPHLAYNTDAAASSDTEHKGELPSAEAVMEAVRRSGDVDLVGVLASGEVQRGFLSSFGQRNWHSAPSFNFDWSVFSGNDTAVKSGYAGNRWRSSELETRLRKSRDDLAIVQRPARVVEPGRYRVYLAPAAMEELFSILSWDGFGLRGWKTRVSPFVRLHDGAAQLAESVSLSENIEEGVAAPFESSGFSRPPQVALVEHGASSGHLVSPRSAREFGAATNGANANESPESLDMAAGDLDAERIAETLHTGLLVSNLWYLNFSDRQACRTTGMTRFATVAVENGRVVGPVRTMRFDDSAYRALGENLVGLTRQRDWILSSDTYEWRSTKSARLPGALIDDFTLTL